MIIKIICFGSIKEKYLKEAINDYSKRINNFNKLEIIELKETCEPKNLTEGAIQKVKEKEYQEFISKIDYSNSYMIGLFLEGKTYDSVQFSEQINKWMSQSKTSLIFLIGGSNGLDDRFIKMCHQKVSFSQLTFPHQLMRLILLEQIYRSFKILNNQKYHK